MKTEKISDKRENNYFFCQALISTKYFVYLVKHDLVPPYININIVTLTQKKFSLPFFPGLSKI